jgi:hypothetical protein
MLVFIIRTLFFLAMAATGFMFGRAMGTGNELWGMIGFAGGAVGIIVLDALFRRKDIKVISAVFFGLVVGVVVAALLGPVLDMYETTMTKPVTDIVKIAIATLTAYLAISLILQTKDDFRFIIPYIEFAKQQKGGRPLLLDTSVIIDGRIADIAETHFIDAPLVVPRFVLMELQAIADSADKLKRDRGRRGLDILNRLQTIHGIDVRIEDASAPNASGEGVDQLLVRVAMERSGRVTSRVRRRDAFSESRMREIRPSGSMSDLLETEYGRASEAPPTERGGQRLCPAYPTAPDFNSAPTSKRSQLADIPGSQYRQSQRPFLCWPGRRGTRGRDSCFSRRARPPQVFHLGAELIG